MMTNPVGSLQANSAAFRWQQNADRILHFCGNSKDMELQMQQDSFQYKAYNEMQDTNDRITKQNIKRTFEMFM